MYIAATIRNAATWNEFRKLCSDEKLEIIELEYDVTKGTLFHFDRSTPIKLVQIKKSWKSLKIVNFRSKNESQVAKEASTTPQAKAKKGIAAIWFLKISN